MNARLRGSRRTSFVCERLQIKHDEGLDVLGETEHNLLADAIAAACDDSDLFTRLGGRPPVVGV